MYNERYPFYGIPAVIAVNMIMAGASGGTLAIIIAVCAQVRQINDANSYIGSDTCTDKG